MPVIYQPAGKAYEYAPLAANLYKGCGHECDYCYVPLMLKKTGMTREQFHKPAPREGVLKQLEKDAKKFAGDSRGVLLCFTSDPYQPIEEDHGITREAIRILADNDIRPTILTKAGPWPLYRDRELLKKANAIWAATLTFRSRANSEKWEPNAASPDKRIDALKMAKEELGLQTWVSFEPVLSTAAVYGMISETRKFVDLFKVGKLNRHPHEKTINWSDFKEKVEDLLQTFDKPYYLKKDLVEAWEKGK